MEILICLISIFFILNRKIEGTSIQIEDLPVGKNPKGYFDEHAFTEIYLNLKNQNQ